MATRTVNDPTATLLKTIHHLSVQVDESDAQVDMLVKQTAGLIEELVDIRLVQREIIQSLIQLTEFIQQILQRLQSEGQ